MLKSKIKGKNMKGKINSIYAAMIVASMPFSSFANDASYTVIVDKSANYTVKPINHLPSEETGVQATVANLTTNKKRKFMLSFFVYINK